MSEIIQVVTTTETREQAAKIARTLVEQRFAACVQIAGPIESTYWWQDRVETAEEWQCTAKTSRSLYRRLELAIQELHPYDVPEILATPVIEGSEGYRRWVQEQVQSL